MKRGKVGVVGLGVVGRSLTQLFRDDAVTYDVDSTDEDRLRINECDVAFVCVPTPCRDDGQCDTSIVEESVQWIESPLIVIRSTIAPGTTDRLRREFDKALLFQPEYLGETVQHPLSDVRDRDFIILGGPLDEASQVAEIYKRYYHSHLRFYFTSALTAELAKYMENAFYASKVMFCNEFYDVAKAHGVDFNELRELWLADPRISRDHTFVYPDNRGFSGKCLPKDVTAIIRASAERGFNPPLLRTLMKINAAYRRRDPTYDLYDKLFASDNPFQEEA